MENSHWKIQLLGTQFIVSSKKSFQVVKLNILNYVLIDVTKNSPHCGYTSSLVLRTGSSTGLLTLTLRKLGQFWCLLKPTMRFSLCFDGYYNQIKFSILQLLKDLTADPVEQTRKIYSWISTSTWHSTFIWKLIPHLFWHYDFYF